MVGVIIPSCRCELPPRCCLITSGHWHRRGGSRFQNLPDGRFVGKVPWKRCRPCQKAGTFFFDGFDQMECRFLEESGWWDVFDTGYIHHIPWYFVRTQLICLYICISVNMCFYILMMQVVQRNDSKAITYTTSKRFIYPSYIPHSTIFNSYCLFRWCF